MKTTNTIEQVSSWYTTDGFYAQLVRLGHKTIQPYFYGTSLLEIGPADGAMTQLLTADFSRVTLLEPSQKYAKQLRAQFPDATIIQNTAEHVDTTVTYDTIILAHVLEHISKPVSTLKRIRKLMKPKSKLIIIVPNANSIHRFVGVGMGLIAKRTHLTPYDHKLGHKRVYTPELLTKHIQQANLRVVASGGILLKPLSNDQMKSWDPDVINGLYKAGTLLPDLCAELYIVCGNS